MSALPADQAPRLDVAPVRAWLTALVTAERQIGWGSDAEGRVAGHVGIPLLQLRRLLKARGKIYESEVDEMACNHGGIMATEIYERYATTRPAAVATPLPNRRCARPGCHELVKGTRPAKIERKVVELPSYHCEEHRLELARIRDDLNAEGKLMSDNGGAQRAHSKARTPRAPTCCAPHCWNPRCPPKRFCDECTAEGFSEGDYE